MTNIPGLLIDSEDQHIIEQVKWYVRGKDNYVVMGKFPPRIYLHRFIMNPPKGMVVDHINGNPLDNRKSNLRIVSHQRNIINRTKLNKNNTSGVSGVVWIPGEDKWKAQLMRNGKGLCLGRFKTIEEASACVSAYLEREKM